ncbi:MAG: LacI family DNA-binding transcriptional regulator [Eubacteriales bacterium]|nr:LacI family DNA-binding transcriptional regulator [Eubacteriales bacterium]
MSSTLRDVARTANVSTATASLVLNGKARRISQETIQRVLAAAEALNYVPNRSAQSLVSGRRKIVALVMPELENSFFSSLSNSIIPALQAAGYNVLMGISANNAEEEKRLLEQMLGEGVAALLLCTSSAKGSQIQEDICNLIRSARIPTVQIDRKFELENSPCIYVDSFEGARRLCKHLIDEGYRRIAAITGPPQQFSVTERLRGYRYSLEEAGINYDEDLIYVGDYRVNSGYEAIPSLLPFRPDCIFAFNDMIALGALKALGDLGKQVPQDIALAGYDDNYYSPMLHVPISSVRQPIEAVASASVERLLALIQKGKSPGLIEDLVLKPELRIRQSSLS